MGESVNVAARVAGQLRSISDFEVTQFDPRTDGAPEGCLMVADRLELVRSALIGVLSVWAVAVRRRGSAVLGATGSSQRSLLIGVCRLAYSHSMYLCKPVERQGEDRYVRNGQSRPAVMG